MCTGRNYLSWIQNGGAKFMDAIGGWSRFRPHEHNVLLQVLPRDRGLWPPLSPKDRRGQEENHSDSLTLVALLPVTENGDLHLRLLWRSRQRTPEALPPLSQTGQLCPERTRKQRCHLARLLLSTFLLMNSWFVISPRGAGIFKKRRHSRNPLIPFVVDL